MKRPSFPSNPILVVDDEESTLKAFKNGLYSTGINNILLCQDAREVMPLLSTNKVEVILLDLTMPFISGDKLLPKIAEKFPETPVIVITGNNEVNMAVECMKTGAFDYMVKPVEKNRLVSVVKRAMEIRSLQNENQILKDHILSGSLEHPKAFSDIITNNRAMLGLFQYTESIAQSSKPLLITGETGVGKELMAKAVHAISRLQGPLITVNAAGLDDNVFSDTLFGHIKGAYTGADGIRQGLIEKAASGSLFLDEIGDVSLNSQVKLLRVIEEKEYFPIGADLPKIANVRIIIATNKDLQALCASGSFRSDLYYRLCSHHIHVPPLCERLDDLPLLISHFFETIAESLGKKAPSFPSELIPLLSNYSFPGNIRELKTMIYESIVSHKSKIMSLDQFKNHIKKTQSFSRTEHVKRDFQFTGSEPLPTLEEASRALITEAMKRSGNNQSMAARFLGITRQRLARQLKSFSK